ncbi:hypothetical protein ACJJIQ_01935 [Microbulbifer sp. ANSA003]|uniref:hypothetical protein n=1 Tax=Microbulbifer sp. ANSA003 TaxID=3243360 RepID=UPI004041FA1F
MSKHVSCIINELEESEIADDDFSLFMILLKIDDSGEVTSTESIEPIGKIGVDIDNEECLFHIATYGKPLKISEAYAEIETIDSRFSLVSVIEKEFDDSSWVRMDNPVIGFGENVNEKRFFIVCRA